MMECTAASPGSTRTPTALRGRSAVIVATAMVTQDLVKAAEDKVGVKGCDVI